MSNKITFIVIPANSSQVRRVVIPKKVLWTLLSISLFFIVGISIILFHYADLIKRASENYKLKNENTELAIKLGKVEARISSISKTLERIERFDGKLRMMTRLNDPDRKLAMGPVNEPQQSSTLKPEELTADQLEFRLSLHNYNLDALEEKAKYREKSLSDLTSYLDAQKALLAHTPAIWPVRGWVTSDFGYRMDPYTGTRTFHRGIDVSNDPGTEIFAPADGEVIFSGENGSYGKFIAIDHGYGIITRYGHLQEIKVKIGTLVHRGELIGKLGNTGRSTGPHLHYEVEVDGIPVNPSSYILD